MFPRIHIVVVKRMHLISVYFDDIRPRSSNTDKNTKLRIDVMPMSRENVNFPHNSSSNKAVTLMHLLINISKVDARGRSDDVFGCQYCTAAHEISLIAATVTVGMTNSNRPLPCSPTSAITTL